MGELLWLQLPLLDMSLPTGDEKLLSDVSIFKNFIGKYCREEEVVADTRKGEEKEDNSRPQSGIFNRRRWNEDVMEQGAKKLEVKESERVKTGEEEVKEQGLKELEVKDKEDVKEEGAKKKEEINIDQDDLPMILIKD